MDVFNIREQLIDDYRAFTTAFVDIYDPIIMQYVHNRLEADEMAGAICAGTPYAPPLDPED